ncbi:MAG: NAD-glutamate dehydrogenase domain-containing protein, partial [Rhodanobacter sp.]
MSSIPSVHEMSPSLAVFDELKKLGLSAQRLATAQVFCDAFFSRMSSGDAELHTLSQWAVIIASLLDFMQQREPNQTLVRVLNPKDANGGRSLLQIVTDDMPFLVDSTSMVLGHRQLVHAAIHPVLCIVRAPSGEMSGVAPGAGADGKLESVMHFEIDRVPDSDRAALVESVENALDDVRAAVQDWEAMRDKALAISLNLPERKVLQSVAEVTEASEFLRWLTADNFTFLGYREYEVTMDAGQPMLRAVASSGLGILRNDARTMAPRSLQSLVATALPQSGSTDAIILTKTNARSDVHRAGYMDYVGVLKFDAAGKPTAEQRFLGLFSSNAYMARPQDVPLLRHRVAAVLARSGLKRDSYSGKALLHVLEMLPRDELLQSSEDELFTSAIGVLELRQRPRTRLFIRRDRYDRFFSCMVFVPRDRFNTSVRERIEALLGSALRAEQVDSAVQMGEGTLARITLVIRPKIGDKPSYDLPRLETQVADIARDFADDVREELMRLRGDQEGVVLANRYAHALPAGYIADVSAAVAAEDIYQLSLLQGDDALRTSLYHPEGASGTLRFKVYRSGGDIALSEVLPQLENLGLRVLTEHVYEIANASAPQSIQDFEVQPLGECRFDVQQVGTLFEDAFAHVWRGAAESDGFNRLVLGAKLSWRQVAMLRGYCKYMLQTGVTFSQAYMENALNHYPAVAGLLVELFLAKFDPQRETRSAADVAAAAQSLVAEIRALIPVNVQSAQPTLIAGLADVMSKPRKEQLAAIHQVIGVLLENVASLDEDRILRSFVAVIRATLRTSFFQLWGGAPRPYISYKFDSHQVPDLPKPVPFREIWVCAPRVEGIHLRFGPVARGGLRWSDRPEDFRTEVLGLVKAQMVKNTVIVPVGSKGGFFVKKPPVGGDRDAQQAEGIACYQMLNQGMLDLTDNLVDNKIVHPLDVVRHDDDDPYLVVAADKGTAKFSDIANAISIGHEYWLGDAYASGGSHGYDHKGMGITARGAWESVKRHFRSLNRDCQTQDFTCVGIGDMSGDVFGNGMLLSEHTCLLAA